MKALIGIISPENMRKRMLDIAGGRLKPAEGEPKVWFASLNAIGQILSNENVRLLKIMEKHKPQSVTELAEISGRQVSNLSVTLKSLEGLGFVTIVKTGKKKVPVANYTDFLIHFDGDLIEKQESEAA